MHLMHHTSTLLTLAASAAIACTEPASEPGHCPADTATSTPPAAPVVPPPFRPGDRVHCYPFEGMVDYLILQLEHAQHPDTFVRASWVEVHCDDCAVPMEHHWLVGPGMAPEPKPMPYSFIGYGRWVVDSAEDYNDTTTTFSCLDGELDTRATLVGVVELIDGTTRCLTSGVEAESMAMERGCTP